MLVCLNGKQEKIYPLQTLRSFLEEQKVCKERIAVACNQVVIKKEHWADLVLKNGDQIEVIQPMQGG